MSREDHTVATSEGAPDVRVQIYRAVEASIKPTSAFLWIQGGGFFLGRSVDNEAFCEQVVLETGAVVVSVDYRLASEHPFPAALDDCYAALKWLDAGGDELHVDTGRIAVGGVSAGAIWQPPLDVLARDRGGPALCFQFLLVPVTDDHLVTAASYEVNDARVWNRGVSVKTWAAYLAGTVGPVSSYSAPARATNLSGLPPAYVYVEEQYVLRDEDITYAHRLMQAGVLTELHVYPGTFHGSYAFVPTAEISQRAVCEHLATIKCVLCTH